MKSFLSVTLIFLLSLQLRAQKLPDSFVDGKFITVNGAKLWVVVAGKGDPLVIIPGGPGTIILVTGHLIHWQIIIGLFILTPMAEANRTLQKT
jgi:hypothetical protein